MAEPFSVTLRQYRDELNWVREIGWSDEDLDKIPVHEEDTSAGESLNLMNVGETSLGVRGSPISGGSSADARSLPNLYVYRDEVPDELWHRLEALVLKGMTYPSEARDTFESHNP